MKRRRVISKRQRRVFLVRRIVAVIVLIAFLSAVFGIIWGIAQGVEGINRWIHRGDINAISRQAAPSPRQVSGVSDCSAEDISLELKATPTTVGVGGTVHFTATIAHSGSDNCLINASNASRVLTISSGSQTIWKSDVCPVSTRKQLLSNSDSDIQSIAWNTNATGSTCQSDSNLLKVNAGTYQAQLSMKNDSKLTSNQVTIAVQ
ncbi:hypothetical protein [Bifidobacterium aquikefiri]|uniref:hypothetical protein n=1 Tax=Bifidobacterium aquikefiri TaxID=1653207 RepID=UPI0039E86240